MPPADDDLSGLLTGFLAGDERCRSELVHKLTPWLRRRATRLAPPDFPRRGLIDDIVSRTWELLLRRPAGAFDASRGGAKPFLIGVLRTAVRDVRASHRAVVGPTRAYTVFEVSKPNDRPGVRRQSSEQHGVLAYSTVDDFLWLASIRPPGGLGDAVTAIGLGDSTFVGAAADAGRSRFSLKRHLAAWATAELASTVA